MPRSLRSYLGALLLLCGGAILPITARAQEICPGDCNDDGTIDAGDLSQVIEAIFADEPEMACPGLSAGTPAAVDLISAISRAGGPCFPVRAPVLPADEVYHTYSGFEIALPVGAQDDGPLDYSAEDLPEGATFETDTGILRWTPGAEQIGLFTVPFRVTDRALPQSASEGALHLRVTPLDACTVPSCDPATGCTGTLVPLSENCCASGPVTRVPEFFLECPQNAVLMVGRNANTGFGRVQNCDNIRLLAFSQVGVTVRIHFATTCLSINEIIGLHFRLETADKLLADRDDTIVLRPTTAPFDQKINYVAPLSNAMMTDEGHEANLSITLTDPITQIELRDTIRVVLTHAVLSDLPDVSCPGAPPPVACPSDDS